MVAPQAASDNDQLLVAVLSRFAALTDVVLRNPERWLGWGRTPAGPSTGRLAGAAGRLLADAPGGEHWAQRTPDERAEWWVTHIANLAGLLAAAPRLAGAAADRLPLQAALGASVAGIAVCAVALEHGVHDHREWVPLLGRVLFDRALPQGLDLNPREMQACLDGSAHDGEAAALTDSADPALHRASSTARHLAWTMLSLQGLFDERPRGARVFRAIGKLPGVGLVGGWLDERGGLRKAAQATVQALATP